VCFSNSARLLGTNRIQKIKQEIKRNGNYVFVVVHYSIRLTLLAVVVATATAAVSSDLDSFDWVAGAATGASSKSSKSLSSSVTYLGAAGWVSTFAFELLILF